MTYISEVELKSLMSPFGQGFKFSSSQVIEDFHSATMIDYVPVGAFSIRLASYVDMHIFILYAWIQRGSFVTDAKSN